MTEGVWRQPGSLLSDNSGNQKVLSGVGINRGSEECLPDVFRGVASAAFTPLVRPSACCARRCPLWAQVRTDALMWAGAGAVAASSQVVASALSLPAGFVLPAGRALVWTQLLATDLRAQKGSKGLRNVSTVKLFLIPSVYFWGWDFFWCFDL